MGQEGHSGEGLTTGAHVPPIHHAPTGHPPCLHAIDCVLLASPEYDETDLV